ncbi:MAG: Rne/Rng family ribonuclease [Myxococcota bacterium]
MRRFRGCRCEGAEEPRTIDFRAAPSANIADVLREGETVLVQVQKDPLGTKGARLTRQVSIAGRNVVLMPFSNHIGVSQRIEDALERERLRAALVEIAGGQWGFVIRTAAEGVEDETLHSEASLLIQLWEDICQRGHQGPVPRLVFADLDLVLRATRDLFSGQVDKILVDDDVQRQRIVEFISRFSPADAAPVELYDKPEPIFDHFGIEVEIERALERRVWLKSGGYIIIDQAEALAVIDVNSGRYVGKSSLEDTITQINLEAVKEVAYQLRLRNIGGIIIIDFIDMSDAANREKVLGALEEALRRDKVKTTIVRMSEIGLVEMTRKRVRDSLGQSLTEACPYCKGRGYVKSEQTVANEILRATDRLLLAAKQPSNTLLINMQPGIADYLYANENETIAALELNHKTTIIPVAREGFHREHYEIVGG